MEIKKAKYTMSSTGDSSTSGTASRNRMYTPMVKMVYAIRFMPES
jgi:hypothetical protein